MKKKDFFVSLFLYTLGFFIIFSSGRFIFSTNWLFLILLGIGTYLFHRMELKLGKYSFASDILITIPFLLFVSPETATLFSAAFWFIFSKRNRFIRSAFSFFLYSVGTFFYYLIPVDYLRIPAFAITFLIANILLDSLYFGKEFFLNLVNPLFYSSILIILSSLIISNIYLFSEITFPYILMVFFTYSFLLFLIISFVKNYNLVLLERIESYKLRSINNNLYKIPDLVYRTNDTEFDENIEKLLKLFCEISGFERALLSVFDKSAERVIRVSQHGLTVEEWNFVKSGNPELSTIKRFFQERFRKEGVYFIPEGSLSLENFSYYVFAKYPTFDIENSWKRGDILLVPIYTELGEMVGYISYDKPSSGLRPTEHELKLLGFLSWFMYELLKKTPYSRYWLTSQNSYLKKLSYPEFVRLAENIIRETKDIVVAIIDIDQLDKFNFTNGPEYGEVIVNSLENYLKDKFGKFSISYKIGGGQFISVFFNVNKLKVIMYFSRMLEEIHEIYPELSLSIGISTSEKYKDLNRLLKDAKKALHVAKKAGGGRIMSL
ncbi:diguanylate cyclase [Thermosipho ferrireducens]|uniref:Diguanylate cyclase n=1 Tax=Thermosipho ferrireducens TaxID=2571116 RepID=A0ABX7SAS9_9BACT|nr:diguanylate cyclase [Thermosipho ferrireducens]QTA38553.1 diguanylate cyclase [Thermosipho ferrireducens]